MPARPTALFISSFFLVTLVEMTSESLSVRWLHYSSKPLIIVLLFLYAGQTYRRSGLTNPVRWLLVGLVFALLGDIFLMIRAIDLFAAGLGAFLIMQLCYCRVFWLFIRQSKKALPLKSVGSASLPFIAYGAAFIFVLYPAFSETPSLTPLWWPVVGYTVCLCSMGLLATQIEPLQWNNLLRTGSVGVGALLFILSDSIIAINKFLHTIPADTWLVMSTYAAAQYLIVVGMLHQLSRHASDRHNVTAR